MTFILNKVPQTNPDQITANRQNTYINIWLLPIFSIQVSVQWWIQLDSMQHASFIIEVKWKSFCNIFDYYLYPVVLTGSYQSFSSCEYEADTSYSRSFIGHFLKEMNLFMKFLPAF